MAAVGYHGLGLDSLLKRKAAASESLLVGAEQAAIRARLQGAEPVVPTGNGSQVQHHHQAMLVATEWLERGIVFGFRRRGQVDTTAPAFLGEH